MSEPTSPAASAPLPPEEVKAAFRWFLVGFGLLGLCVGYLAGASDSPVVAVVLPLLFGLVSGGAGFFLAGADPSSPKTVLRLRMLGMGLLVFLLPFLAGSAYGIMLRTGLGAASFFPRSFFFSPQPASLAELGAKSAPEGLKLITMRSRLKALGATETEQTTILGRLTKDGTDAGSPPEFAPTLRRLAGLAEKVRAAIPEGAGAEMPTARIDRLGPILDAYVKDYKDFAKRIDDGEKTPAALVAYYITQFSMAIDDVANIAHLDRTDLAYLAKHDVLRQELAELRWQLLQEGERVAANPSVNGSAAAQEADQFLSLFSGPPDARANALIDKPRLGPHFAP